MKTRLRQFVWSLAICALTLMAPNVMAYGYEYLNDSPVPGWTNWPAGLVKLVNTTNRVHGFFLNQQNVFFFSGDAAELTAFLRVYSGIEGIESRRLILHEGVGEAKSHWDKTGRACDWKLYGCPKGWHNIGVLSQQGTNSVEVLRKAAQEPGYILEMHFWTGGRIPLDQVTIPKNVEVKREK